MKKALQAQTKSCLGKSGNQDEDPPNLPESVLGEFYEPVFCEFSVPTLYTELLVCHCSWIENSTRFSFCRCLTILFFSVGICWFSVNKPLFDKFELKALHYFSQCCLWNLKYKLLLIRQCLKFVDISDFLLLVWCEILGNDTIAYSCEQDPKLVR